MFLHMLLYNALPHVHILENVEHITEDGNQSVHNCRRYRPFHTLWRAERSKQTREVPYPYIIQFQALHMLIDVFLMFICRVSRTINYNT